VFQSRLTLDALIPVALIATLAAATATIGGTYQATVGGAYLSDAYGDSYPSQTVPGPSSMPPPVPTPPPTLPGPTAPPNPPQVPPIR
jgi:hypothetical protein